MNKHETPREAYVTLASQRFATDGYHGTSLAKLAKDAGVTKQALLHFFSTKERLYAEVLAELAERQYAEIDGAAGAGLDAVGQLASYFVALPVVSSNHMIDARLVVRALLDSDEKARIWPMKPYLNKLISLVQQTPGGKPMSDAQALAWVVQTIGSIQYLLVALPTMSGMYGKEFSSDVVHEFRQAIRVRIQALSVSAG